MRTVAQPEGTGERYTVNDLAFGLGYGRQISERFSLGLQFTYLSETIWHSTMSAFALNVGTLYQISPDGLRIGASSAIRHRPMVTVKAVLGVAVYTATAMLLAARRPS